MFLMTRTRTNEEWLHHLREKGVGQEHAIADLQNILLRAVLYIFNRQGETVRPTDCCMKDVSCLRRCIMYSARRR